MGPPIYNCNFLKKRCNYFDEIVLFYGEDLPLWKNIELIFTSLSRQTRNISFLENFYTDFFIGL